MYIFTQPTLGRARWRLSENLHCKSHWFFTKWWDPLDLSKLKKLLDMLYIDPRGVREGTALIFSGKSVFEKHPIVDSFFELGNFSQRHANSCSESHKNDMTFESIFGLPHNLVCILYVTWYGVMFWRPVFTHHVTIYHVMKSCRPAVAECWHLWPKASSHR